jgi:hypothetical protein
MPRFSRRPAVALAALAMATACGTTVSTSAVRQSVPASGDGGLGTAPVAGLSSTQPGAGSGSDGSRSVAGTPGTGSGPASTASGPDAAGGGSLPSPGGASSVPATGPLKVGILYSINDAATPAGIQNGNTFSPSQVVRALVDSYNKSGGIAGRHIEPVYAALHSYNNDYEQQVAAACASFTQDNHVSVVLTNAGYYSEQLLSCLSKASVPLISGDFAGADRKDARTYPGFIAPTTLVAEDRESSVVTHLSESGWLTHANRVGVIIENCPIDNRIYRNGLAPALSRANVPVASTFETQCFQSIQDFGAETSQMSNAVVRFRSKNVDRVMVVSAGAEGNLVFAFSEVADGQRWYPGYALSSLAVPEVQAQNGAATQLANMRGVGWLPTLDSQDRQQFQPNAAGRDCLDRMHHEGVQPQSNTDYAFVYEPCDTFRLLDAITRAANGAVSLDSVIQGERTVGGSFESATNLAGRTRLWQGGELGPSTGRLFAFVNGAFKYTSQPFAL